MRKDICSKGHIRNADTCYGDGHCKTCHLQNQQFHYANNPKYRQKQRAHHLRSSYGITQEDYEAMFKAQNGKCYICQKSRALVVDHNHATGQVRHLLCYGCNSMIGLARESQDIFQRAVDYVRQ